MALLTYLGRQRNMRLWNTIFVLPLVPLCCVSVVVETQEKMELYMHHLRPTFELILQSANRSIFEEARPGPLIIV